jgi:HD-like signal output (HDOD) protein
MATGWRPPRMEQGDMDSAILSHCRRVAALAMEVSRMARLPAALLHSIDPTSPPEPPDLLAPPGLRQVETVAGIIRLCSLVDQQFEALQFGYEDVETILDEIQRSAPGVGFDPALVEHFRQMRCRSLPQQISRGDGLPVEARAAREVFGLLGRQREYEVRELAATALRDPVLAASLIRVANSSLYSPASKLSVVGQAISYIGIVEARKVMLAAVLRPMFASAGLTRLWSHSVSAAQFGSALVGQTSIASAEEGLMLGLVHDFGSLAIQFAPRETRDIFARLVERGCPATYVERLLFGCDHGEIGADILAQWNFPGHLIDAVRFHHQPERSDGTLAAIAYLVEFWSGLDEDLPSFHRVEDCLARTGLSLEAMTEITAEDGKLKTLRSLA